MRLRAPGPRLLACLLLAVSGSCHRTGALEDKPEVPASASGHVLTRPRPTMAELDRACTMGDGFSCWQLGQKYYKGDDLPKDEQRAATYFYRGCFSDSNSCLALGLLHREGRRGSRKVRGFVELAGTRLNAGDMASGRPDAAWASPAATMETPAMPVLASTT